MYSKIIDNYKKNSVFFIAEVGTTHRGNKDKAISIIDEFSKKGINIFKFQHVIAKEILHPKTGVLNLVGKQVNLYESFLQLEQSKSFFKEIKTYCDQKGFLFFASSFGIDSTNDLLDIGVNTFKVASPESNYTKLIKYYNQIAENIFLSSGVTKLEDIEYSFRCLDKTKTVLLHCVTQYPAIEEDMNLLLLPSLKNYFNVLVGLSDHSLDILAPCVSMILSKLMGDDFVLEKHITLDKGGGGLDDKISLLPEDVEKLNNYFELINKNIKEDKSLFKHLNPIDGIGVFKQEIIDIIVDVIDYDKERINKILGDGVKRLAKCEEDNYRTTNRSYRAICSIKKGDLITEKNIAFLRSEKNLEPGLDYHHDNIIGKAMAVEDIEVSKAITEKNIEID